MVKNQKYAPDWGILPGQGYDLSVEHPFSHNISDELAGKKLIFFVPPPLKASGGHRTIFRHINHLASKGAIVEACVVGKNSEIGTEKEIRESIFGWFGILLADISTFTPRMTDPYGVVATSWWSAFSAAKYPVPKVYFVQDLENVFNPANEVFAKALYSYQLEMNAITIGKWLQGELGRFGSKVLATPFGVDEKSYFTNSKSKRKNNSVIVLDQPEKSRRCHALLQEIVDDLRKHDPNLDILSYGTSVSYLKGITRHLGLLAESELGDLYRENSLGIALSASNPSRVPFEMAACGMPFIDLDLPNNQLDYIGLKHSLVAPFSKDISEEVLRILKSQDSDIDLTSIPKVASINEELETFASSLAFLLEIDTNIATRNYEVFSSEQSKDKFNPTLVLKKALPLKLRIEIKKWLQ